ncbi:hypothetical protein D3C81_1286100 [compost metagenome]
MFSSFLYRLKHGSVHSRLAAFKLDGRYLPINRDQCINGPIVQRGLSQIFPLIIYSNGPFSL